jgi:hypothetical protein
MIRATPLEAARHEVATNATGPSARDPRVRAVLNSTDAVSRIAEAMDQAWHELLAADWPQLRAICERDVVHRVGVIGEHGWVTTIESRTRASPGNPAVSRSATSPKSEQSASPATGSCKTAVQKRVPTAASSSSAVFRALSAAVGSASTRAAARSV